MPSFMSDMRQSRDEGDVSVRSGESQKKNLYWIKSLFTKRIGDTIDSPISPQDCGKEVYTYTTPLSDGNKKCNQRKKTKPALLNSKNLKVKKPVGDRTSHLQRERSVRFCNEAKVQLYTRPSYQEKKRLFYSNTEIQAMLADYRYQQKNKEDRWLL